MFEVGQKARIKEESDSIYGGRTVEISRVCGYSRNMKGEVNQQGYAVKGLTGTGSEISTFWDDQLEAV